MRQSLLIPILGIFVISVIGLGCSKPALYGTLQENEAVDQYFDVPPKDAFRAAQESLLFLGYSLKINDPDKMLLETYWQPTTSDSHYVEVFGRKDFGTVGAYYRLMIKVKPRNNGSLVFITNSAKSIISRLKTSRVEESRVMNKVADFTRKRDIQVTNIGLQ